MTLADRYHWTPKQVDRMDPAFVDELMAYQTARSDHELFSADAKDNPELRMAQTKRRTAIARWRDGK